MPISTLGARPVSIVVQGAKGRAIRASVSPPATPGPAPVVLLAPDLLLDPEAGPLPRVARALAEAGFVAISYDGSTAPASGAYRETTFSSALDDLARVLDAVFERMIDDGLAERIDNRRLGVFGHGLGGAVAVAGAARDTRLRAVAAAGAPGTASEALSPRELEQLALKGHASIQLATDGPAHELDSRFLSEWRARAGEYDLAPNAERLSVPLLLAHGTEDRRAPIDGARAAFFRQSRLARLVEVETAGHAFEGRATDALVDAVTGFFDQTLGSS